MSNGWRLAARRHANAAGIAGRRDVRTVALYLMQRLDWRTAAFLYAGIVALGLGYALVMMPFQVSDNLGNMLTLKRSTLAEIILSQARSRAFMRPLLWVQLKLVFDLADGHEFLVFRLFQIAQLLAVLLLVTRLLAVKTRADFAAVPLAIAMVIGSHTFGGTVREAYPINTFMTVLVCCAAVVNLAWSAPRWWKDGLAIVILAYAALSVETGLLVWVCLVTGFLVGLRGVSAKGIVASTGFLLVYFYARFVFLDVGGPNLLERSTGVGFAVLDPDQLLDRFVDRPFVLYAYNIGCSILTVLFSEPRAGVWVLTRAMVQGGVHLWMVIGAMSSCVTTTILVAFIARRVPHWRSLRVEHADRMCLIALAILLANAVISYPYTKDVVMSPSGMFYGIVSFFAVRWLVTITWDAPTARRVAVCLALAIVSVGWTVRLFALPYAMRQTAFTNRNDWASVYAWLDDQQIAYDAPSARALVERLRSEALSMQVPNPHFLVRGDDIFDLP